MLNNQIRKVFAWISPKSKKPFILLVGVISLFVLLLLAYNLVFFRKIYPGVSVAGVFFSGLTQQEATEKLSSNIKTYDKMILSGQDQSFEIDVSAIDFSYNFSDSAKSAYTKYRTGNIASDLLQRLKAPFNKTHLALKINLDEKKLAEHLLIISDQVAQAPVYPNATFVEGEVVVEKGTAGSKVDIEGLRQKIIQNLSQANYAPIPIPVVSVDPTLSEEEAKRFKERAEKLVGKSLLLNFEYQTFTLKENEMLNLLTPNGNYNEEEISVFLNEMSIKLNREPQNAVFVFEKGRVKEFAPAKDGLTVDQESLKGATLNSLSVLGTSDEKTATIDIPLAKTSPKITTDQVNNLGIKELLGRGTSRFSGSIASRIHNIGVASAKFNGALVPPDEVFSFNNVLGDVSVYTGYKQAYIIKDGRTVLGDGGGVCQVSTTFFRAALDAGLPIVERRAHSYRVYYYEQDSLPGIDATVYAPTTDLKFMNDTPGHILIQTQVDPGRATLVFEIYGTSDGRVATTTKPVVTDIVPPPEDLYQDDPTLPAGTTKQIDWKAWGARVWFDYEVERNGEIIYYKTFYSNFRPWQAVYLRGTGPIN